jgi:hypothetical protein
MKKQPLFILLICILAFACKKSNSPKKPSGPLLTKYVDIQDQDSVVYDLAYDQNDRIVSFTFTGYNIIPGSPDISSTQITRNGAGIITKYINSYPSPDPQLNPNDTVLISYDNNSAHYTLLMDYYRTNSSGQPIDQRDSSVPVYDNTGKIVSLLTYFFDASTGTGYHLTMAHLYSFDQLANLISDSVVAYGAGSGFPQWVINYQYDNNPNPLSLGNEALLLPDRDWTGLPRISGWSSKNNVINGVYTDLQDQISDFSVRRTFSYNAAGLPVSSSDQWQDTEYAPLTAGATKYYY